MGRGWVLYESLGRDDSDNMWVSKEWLHVYSEWILISPRFEHLCWMAVYTQTMLHRQSLHNPIYACATYNTGAYVCATLKIYTFLIWHAICHGGTYGGTYHLRERRERNLWHSLYVRDNIRIMSWTIGVHIVYESPALDFIQRMSFKTTFGTLCVANHFLNAQ